MNNKERLFETTEFRYFYIFKLKITPSLIIEDFWDEDEENQWCIREQLVCEARQ